MPPADGPGNQRGVAGAAETGRGRPRCPRGPSLPWVCSQSPANGCFHPRRAPRWPVASRTARRPGSQTGNAREAGQLVPVTPGLTEGKRRLHRPGEPGCRGRFQNQGKSGRRAVGLPNTGHSRRPGSKTVASGRLARTAPPEPPHLGSLGSPGPWEAGSQQALAPPPSSAVRPASLRNPDSAPPRGPQADAEQLTLPAAHPGPLSWCLFPALSSCCLGESCCEDGQRPPSGLAL